MHNTLKKKINKTLLKSSPSRAWGILVLCAFCITFAIFLRFFIISVWEFDSKKIFICSLPVCKDDSEKNDLLLIETKNGNSILLRQVGKSKDYINVHTPFDTVAFNIAQKGDTIFFDSLSSMLWSAYYALYKEQFLQKKTKVNISLHSKERELPFSYVGRTYISGRPVSEKEVVFLPWQELRLLELQLERIFPALDSIYFKKTVFEDSVEVKSFVVEEELFYLSCEKEEQQKLCYDSRERGFFRKSNIKGISIFSLWL